jgi:folate-binding protein YgfZ
MTASNTLLIAPLPHRGLLAVGGEERADFLHGLLSCALKDLAAGSGAWGALLTAQGKFLHEVFISVTADEILLEGEAERLDDLFTRLKRFRLRRKVTLELRPDWTVEAVWTPEPSREPTLPAPGAVASLDTSLCLGDPRLPTAGWRLYRAPGAALPAAFASAIACDGAAWDRWRCALGLPDGARDMAVEGATLLENGFAELGGVDFKKGCFVGQEVTARMRYRGLVKKRLLPITFNGPTPASGAVLRTADGTDAGILCSLVPSIDGESNGQGLALLRISLREGGPFTAENSSAVVSAAECPQWVVFPPSKETE